MHLRPAEKLGIRNPATIKAMKEFKKRLKEDNERLCSERNPPVETRAEPGRLRKAKAQAAGGVSRPHPGHRGTPGAVIHQGAGQGAQKVEERKARNAERMAQAARNSKRPRTGQLTQIANGQAGKGTRDGLSRRSRKG